MTWKTICIVCDNGVGRSKFLCGKLQEMASHKSWKLNFDYGGLYTEMSGKPINAHHYNSSYFLPVDKSIYNTLLNSGLPDKRIINDKPINSIEEVLATLHFHGFIQD